MERYWVWEYGLFEKNPKRVDSLNPETTLEVVKLADAQATVEALQAQNAEWERKCRDLCQAHGVLLIEHHDVKKELATLRQLVEALINTWVNGRKIHDGIPLTLRQQIDATLAAKDAGKEVPSA